MKEYQTLPQDSALTMGQWLSIPGVLLGYYGVWWSLKRRLPVGWSPRSEEEEPEDERDQEDFEDEDLEDEALDAGRDPDVDEEFAPKRPLPRRKGKKRRREPEADEKGEPEPQPKPKKKRRKKRQKKRSARDREPSQDD